jgi:hypothetical protein
VGGGGMGMTRTSPVMKTVKYMYGGSIGGCREAALGAEVALTYVKYCH